ncbi:hypothetical protein DDB_G0285913 [Dictyostelium discoideum AX4]|uniref:Ankyrin repeat-containing protein n=1 Tax=Dictyostelium discoideum TaxID=44689 RepID=Q54MJ0_DICDI|nr:hypothetical protein DDB_G0285913 [Dictyostelium discoideum AX4]EAL64491.1 hypothetical protein DDB_G0285913 [Dictyostelium discoideum AX4]|eukprot:XP_638000.1 hypothetical protein DDB_G0285913 [Dictyostelium discoideum AX4]
MDNSKLFFTIYRNKFIRSIIWKFVKQIIENKKNLVEGDSKLTFSRKYKDIHQVVWIVNHNHLGLLKSKLENNEYLSFDSDSFNYSILLKVIDECTFDLLYNRYRDEFKNFSDSLIATSIRYGNTGALKVLLKDKELYELHNISNSALINKINNSKFKINGTTSDINEKIFKIKMIDLAIRSGKTETIDFLLQFLEEKQKQLDEIDSKKEIDPDRFPLSKSSVKQLVSETNNEIKSVYDYSNSSSSNGNGDIEPTKISIEKKSLIELHFTEKDLLSNCFKAPFNQIKTTIQYLFFQNNRLPFSIENISLEYYPTCLVKFLDAFNMTNFKQLTFFLENNLIKYDKNDFIELVNSFSFFSNDINPSIAFDYLQKFTYIYENYYCLENKYIENCEPLHHSLQFISSLVNSINDPLIIENLLKTTHTVKIDFLKKDQPLEINGSEPKTWCTYDMSTRASFIAKNHRNNNNINIKNNNNNNNDKDKTNNNVNNVENSINEENDGNNNNNTNDFNNQEFLIININNDDNYKIINFNNIKIENRVMNRIITIYMYSFFYPLIFLFQQAKIDITVNKFLILKNDLSILSEANSIINKFKKVEKVTLKYIAFKEIFISSLETANIEPLKEIAAISKTVKDESYIKEYASLFTLPTDFKMFKYLNGGGGGNSLDTLDFKKNYLNEFLSLTKNDSFLVKFQTSLLFCWLSHEDLEETSFQLLEFLKPKITSNNIANKTDPKTSIPYRAVSSGNHLLTEFCLLNSHYFTTQQLLFLAAINGKHHNIMSLLCKHQVTADEFSFSRAVELNDLTAIMILVENKTPFRAQDLYVSAQHIENPDIFRFLVMNVPIIDESTGEQTTKYLDLINFAAKNNKIIMDILKENSLAFESGVFGDVDSLENGYHNYNLVLENYNKLNTVQMFRQNKLDKIINFLLDYSTGGGGVDENIEYGKQVLLRHTKLLGEAIDFNQMDFLYQLLDIFYKSKVFKKNHTSDLTNEEFNNFVIHCAKSNHYHVLNYLFKNLQLKLFVNGFSSVFSQLSLNHNYLSKDIIQLLFDWSVWSGGCTMSTIYDDLLSMLIESVRLQKFSLFKFINENFLKFNSITMPKQIIKIVKQHQNPNVNFRNYLLFEKNENGETLIDISSFESYVVVENIKLNIPEPKVVTIIERLKYKLSRLDIFHIFTSKYLN